MNSRDLTLELADIRPLLGEAVTSHWGYTDELPLSQTSCGFATALLQRHLMRRHIQTERLIAAPPKLPRSFNYKRREHVILRTEDGQLIDPTYQQFANLVGYTHRLIKHMPDASDLLPAPVIAVCEQEAHEKLGSYVAQKILLHRSAILEAVTTHLKAPSTVDAPLAYAPDDEIYQVCNDIWNPDHYSPFPHTVEEMASPCFRRAEDIMQTKTPKN